MTLSDVTQHAPDRTHSIARAVDGWIITRLTGKAKYIGWTTEPTDSDIKKYGGLLSYLDAQSVYAGLSGSVDATLYSKAHDWLKALQDNMS